MRPLHQYSQHHNEDLQLVPSILLKIEIIIFPQYSAEKTTTKLINFQLCTQFWLLLVLIKTKSSFTLDFGPFGLVKFVVWVFVDYALFYFVLFVFQFNLTVVFRTKRTKKIAGILKFATRKKTSCLSCCCCCWLLHLVLDDGAQQHLGCMQHLCQPRTRCMQLLSAILVHLHSNAATAAGGCCRLCTNVNVRMKSWFCRFWCCIPCFFFFLFIYLFFFFCHLSVFFLKNSKNYSVAAIFHYDYDEIFRCCMYLRDTFLHTHTINNFGWKHLLKPAACKSIHQDYFVDFI